jgi:indolepyruvate ferredoxin oxidoreductase
MAFKDEYEVARLLLDADTQREIAAAAPGRVHYHLHPPVLRAMGMSRKLRLGRWAEPGLRVLARGKRFRGTPLDLFGRTALRRTERQLPGEYRAALERILPDVTGDSLDAAVAIAELPDLVRGYEELKVRRIAEFRDRLATDVEKLTTADADRPTAPPTDQRDATRRS